MNSPIERTLLSISERNADALDTVADALESVEHFIDAQFGAGYAEGHPVLVSGCIQAFALLSVADCRSDQSAANRTNAARMAGVLQGLACGTADAVAEADAFAMGVQS